MSGRIKRGSKESFLRRNDPEWKARHPGADSWSLAPPIPGTRLFQDLYIAKTKPHLHGYKSGEMYAAFSSRAKANSGNPEDALVVYHHGADMRALVDSNVNEYTFHQLVKLPQSSRRLYSHQYNKRRLGRYRS